MKVCHILICFFFLTLQDGNIGLINAQIPIFTETQGQSITIICPFTYIGRRTYFCKDKCKEHILKTYNGRARRGRYIMEYKSTPAGRRLHVTITQLTKSDSGRYRCGLDVPATRYVEFRINVTDVESASIPTTTQSLRRSSTTSFENTNQSEEQQNETTTAENSGVLLYVGLTLVIIVLLFSVVVLMYCKKRAAKPKEDPVETEHANVKEANRVYAEIGEDVRQSRSPPVEIFSTYSAKFTKPNRVKTSRPPNKTEDNLNELVYTQVDFSSGAATSLSSAPRGHSDNVIYSVPNIHTEMGTDAKEVSQPVYSNVILSQQ